MSSNKFAVKKLYTFLRKKSISERKHKDNFELN